MDFALSPLSGDYSNQRIHTLANAVYLRLMTPLGSWWAQPLLGSRLHELQRQKDLTRIGQLARQYARQALQPLLDDGRAQAVVVEVEQPHQSHLLLAVSVTDAAGRVQLFEHPVQVA